MFSQTLTLSPIHMLTTPPTQGSLTLNDDATQLSITADIVYIDPPYNERQYSKNYFPLNIIAKPPSSPMPELKGKTGIPDNCFLSSFCSSKTALSSFETILKNTTAEWIFISYSNESIVPIDTLTSTLSKYGEVSIVQKDYKRFKSFEYNDDKAVVEYLLSLKINNI